MNKAVKRQRSECFDYEKLAEVIVIRSAKDYCSVYKSLLRNPHNHMAIETKKEIEDFFHSKWFIVLSSIEIDPDAMIARLIDKAKSDIDYERKKSSRPEQRMKKEAALKKRKERIARAKARAKAKAEAKTKEETA